MKIIAKIKINNRKFNREQNYMKKYRSKYNESVISGNNQRRLDKREINPLIPIAQSSQQPIAEQDLVIFSLYYLVL